MAPALRPTWSDPDLEPHREGVRGALRDALREHLLAESAALDDVIAAEAAWREIPAFMRRAMSEREATLTTNRQRAEARLREAAHAWEVWLTTEPSGRHEVALRVGVVGDINGGVR